MAKEEPGGEETPSLFGELLPKPDDIEISTAVLRLDDVEDDGAGERPGEDFIRSVLRWGGVFDAIDVRKVGRKYVIIEGRRRLRAMLTLRGRAAEDAQVVAALGDPREWTIPAKVIKGIKDDASVDAYALMKNRQRSENLTFEAGAVQRLYSRGATEADVHKLTGLLPREQERRVAILKAIKPLMKAHDEGRLTVAQLEAAAKLAPDVQKRLADRLREKAQAAVGAEAKAAVRITGKDISEVKRARDTRAAAAMPQALFESSPEDLGSGGDGHKPIDLGELMRAVRDLLREDHVWDNKHRLGALGSQNIVLAVERLEEVVGVKA